MRLLFRLSLCFCSATAVASGLSAQEVLWTIDAEPGLSLLKGFDSISDLDGGGRPDLVVGAQSFARVVVVSTETQEILHDSGFTNLQSFGSSVTSLGDFDGDGIDDYAAGAPSHTDQEVFQGLVRVLSGGTGDVIVDIPGPPISGLRFGIEVDRVGDVNRDGYADVIVGTLGVQIYVHLGPDGALLRTHPGQFTRPSVAGVGDMNFDGHADYIVGWPQDDTAGCGAGRATVYSGKDGSTLHDVFGTTDCLGELEFGDHLGRAVSGIGDVDGDEVPDFIAAAPRGLRAGFQADGPGFVRIYSGADASVIHEVTAENANTADSFGRAVDGGGDFNGDGVPDFIVGAPFDGVWPERGGISVLSGKSGQMLWKAFGPDPIDSWGEFVHSLGDLDGDGFDEFGVSDPNFRGGGGSPSGRITIFQGALGDVALVCDGALNSTGSASTLDTLGPISVGNDRLRLQAAGLPGDTFQVFAYAPMQQMVPFGNGTLCLDGEIFRINDPMPVDASGVSEVPLPFTDPPAGSGPGEIKPGDTWHIQCWYRDPDAGGASFNMSDALGVTFPP